MENWDSQRGMKMIKIMRQKCRLVIKTTIRGIKKRKRKTMVKKTREKKKRGIKE